MARQPLLFLDLSNNNTHVNLNTLAKRPIAGVWHKVGEGPHFVDRDWPERSIKLRKLGKRVGGYYFATPHVSDAKPEAGRFVDLLGEIQRQDLCPFLDFEVNPHGLSPSHLLQWARDFNHEFHRITKVWPALYSFSSFVSALHADHVIGRGLLLAAFGRNDGVEHPFTTPAPFKRALAHQFTSRAIIPGVSGFVDEWHAKRLVPLLAHGWKGL